MTTYIDIHALQSVPPSNLNRDENGSPKTAMYGGVRRHRVSSQSWKKAIRDYYNANYATDNTSYRTKNIVELVVNEMQKNNEAINTEDASKVVVSALINAGIIGKKGAAAKKTSSDALYLISRKQLEALVLILENPPEDEKELKNTVQNSLMSHNSLDLALFGRMVASALDLNVEAVSQFAHSISTHAVTSEFDFFTAVDDFSITDHAGAGMVGDVEFNSSTLYRYASINLDELKKTFSADSEVIAAALNGFIESFVRTVPSGKQNSFAALTLPEVVLVSVRKDQPVSFVGAFEKPVQAIGSGYVKPSVDQFVEFVKSFSENYETHPAPRFAVAEVNSRTAISAIAETGSLLQLKENVLRVILEEE